MCNVKRTREFFLNVNKQSYFTSHWNFEGNSVPTIQKNKTKNNNLHIVSFTCITELLNVPCKWISSLRLNTKIAKK